MSYWYIFIKFGQEEHTGKLKYSLYSTNYCEGILVIFQALSILFVRFHQELTVKIGLGFFLTKTRISMNLQSSRYFSGIFKNRRRRKYSQDTWRTRRVSGVVSRECLRGAAGWYPGGLMARDTCRTRKS